MKIATIVCWILLAAIGSACCEELPDVEKISITRDFAIQMAIRKNLDIRGESLGFTIAEIELWRSRGIYDPAFNASSSGGMTYTPGHDFLQSNTMTSSIGLSQYFFTGGTISTTTQTGFTNTESRGTSTTSWQSSVGINLSQPLLKNAGSRITNLGITLAEISRDDARERFRSINLDTVLSVISSYNRLYTLRQILETRLAALASAENLLREVDRRTQPGPLQVMERADAAFAVAQRRRDLVDTERNLIDQEAILRYLIGLEAKIRIIPVDPPSSEELRETEEQAILTALEIRPELRGLRLTLEATELQERVAHQQTLPELLLTASGGFSGTGATFGKSFEQIGEHSTRFWTAGMLLNVPIGNTAWENDYRRSRVRTEQVRNQIHILSWRIRNDIEADMRALISARLQRQISAQALQIATERLEEYRRNNRAGSSTLQDVITAENDLTAARNGWLEASETFAFALAKLWRDMGVLLERQGVSPQEQRPEKVLKEISG